MNWRALLKMSEPETLISPWLGGRALRSGSRVWTIDGPLPREHGWYEFNLNGRKAKLVGGADATPENLINRVTGYLVGDRIVANDARVDPEPKNIVAHSERVYLIDPGLDRFVLISAGRPSEDGSLVFIQQEMPLGPESDVLKAYFDQTVSVNHVPGVTPALDAAFRMEVWQRAEAEKRRLELERLRREEEEKRQLEERRQQIVAKLGDGQGRREMAQVDFGSAARAALAVGGAEYLDHRAAVRRDEMVVKFRIRGRRYECTCDRNTLRIIDSGICLTAHHDDPDFEEGTKGDAFFSLESLPSVILEADREGRLVVYRHVN